MPSASVSRLPDSTDSCVLLPRPVVSARDGMAEEGEDEEYCPSALQGRSPWPNAEPVWTPRNDGRNPSACDRASDGGSGTGT